MDYQIRLIENIREGARQAFREGKGRDSHTLVRDSFAEMAFHVQYDRCAAQAKQQLDRVSPP